MRFVKIHECAQLVRGSIDPRRHANEQFVLYSIPGYDAGSPEFVRGSDIGSSKTLVSPGDVLFSKLNPRIPRVWVVATGRHLRQICSTEFLPLRPRCNDHLDSYFLRYMCLAPQFLQPIQREVSSSTKSHQRIRPEVLLNGQIPHPPISEQRRIVARIQECLARVEEAQRLQHLALKELDAVLPAYLSELEQSLECPKVAVKELVVSTQNGRSIRSNGDSGNGRVLTLSAVRTPTLDLSAAKTVELDCRTAQNYAIYQGDVFVSRSNTSELVGLAAVANCDGPTNTIYPDLLIRLKPRIERVAPSYLAQALRFPSSRRQIRACAKGTSQSMVKISGAELREVTIPLPALADQEKIVAKIEAIQATCGGLSEALSLNPQALADAVLKKAFAGEL